MCSWLSCGKGTPPHSGHSPDAGGFLMCCCWTGWCFFLGFWAEERLVSSVGLVCVVWQPQSLSYLEQSRWRTCAACLKVHGSIGKCGNGLLFFASYARDFVCFGVKEQLFSSEERAGRVDANCSPLTKGKLLVWGVLTAEQCVEGRFSRVTNYKTLKFLKGRQA